jgi:hypothetical protein
MQRRADVALLSVQLPVMNRSRLRIPKLKYNRSRSAIVNRQS